MGYIISANNHQEERLARSPVRVAAAGFLGYLIGMVPTADVVSRMAAEERGRHVDLRESGTRNPGALNAAKLLGMKWGAAILGADVAKGAAASVLGRVVGGDNGGYAAGTGVVLGHCAPAVRGFDGGKGVAVSAGTSAALFPAYAVFDVALAAGVLALSKGQAGTATYVASGVFVVAATYWWLSGNGNAWGPRATPGLPVFALTTSAMIAYKFLSAPKVANHGYESETVEPGEKEMR
jgi:glycerol-3-phosphate acyltransferase PlsY